MYRVLCIKDVSVGQEFVADGLTDKGLEVSKAYSFSEAVHVLNSFIPEVILVEDSQLSGLDGEQFMARLKTRPELATIPVVGVFRQSIPKEASRFNDLGCAGYLSRQQNIDSIYSKLEGIVNSRHSMNPRLLLMEDDVNIIDMIKTALLPVGIQVVGVTNGFDAMRALQSQKFDLIVTDIMVKGFNGFQLIDYVLKQGAGVPIVVITGAYPNGFDQYAATLGIVDYFEKPFDLNQFIERIDDILTAKKVAS